MLTWAGIDEPGDEELAGALGTTVVLTAEGWEDASYLEPGDDWRPLDDGSYLSPDGTVRTWPLVGPPDS